MTDPLPTGSTIGILGGGQLGRMLSVAASRLGLEGLGLTVAPYADVPDLAALQAAVDRIGTPAILKTRRFGYDGKGQSRLKDPADADQAIADMAGAPAVLEGFVDFQFEVSVIAARGSGAVRHAQGFDR